MRIRIPFAASFVGLLLLAGYAGIWSFGIEYYVDDKVLHLVTFFALTVAFYWILDTTRRRTLNVTLVVCTLVLSVGSEALQPLLTDGVRHFDPLDLVANVVGSLAALGLCSWYHKRMVDRKRSRRGYGAVPGEVDDDLELGEGGGDGASGEVGGGVAGSEAISTSTPSASGDVQNKSTVPAGGSGASAPEGSMNLEEQVDNWDEHAVDDWDDAVDGDGAKAGADKAANGDNGNEATKRPD